MLYVVTVFGAVHCITWHWEFQSDVEQQLWQLSTIILTAIPVALCFIPLLVSEAASKFLTTSLYTLTFLTYVAAHLILITLSFTSLRVLPFAAYQTVLLTMLIPHI